MDQETTIAAPDPSRIPASVRGEFGPQQMDSKTVDELTALEAKIAEAGKPQEAPQEVPKPEIKPEGVPVPQDVVVPDKFKTPDGNLDEQKLEKSLVNLQHYLNLEKEMSQKNSPPPQQPYQPTTPQPQYAPVPFEQRVSEDIQRDPATTVINLMRAAVLQAEQSNSAQTLELRRRLELMEIGQQDPGVYTKQGADKIEKTLKENPWLWASPTPFASAYKMAGSIAPNVGQAAAPARKAAPILPGGPAPSIPAGSPVASEADLRRLLESRFPKDNGNQYLKQADFLEKVMEEMQKAR